MGRAASQGQSLRAIPTWKSMRCLSHNLKYLKKSDRSTAWSTPTTDNGKAKVSASFRKRGVASERARHNTHGAITSSRGTKEHNQYNPTVMPLAALSQRG